MVENSSSMVERGLSYRFGVITECHEPEQDAFDDGLYESRFCMAHLKKQKTKSDNQQ